MSEVSSMSGYDGSLAAESPTEAPKQDTHAKDWINATFVIAASLCLAFSCVSLVALCRSKNLPQTSRFLSATLLVYDCTTTLTYMFRKFITDSDVLNLVTLLGLGWSNAAFLNVAIMALERLVICQWPFFYMRHVTHGTCIKVFVGFMSAYLIVWTGEWANCYINVTGFWNMRRCFDPIVTRHFVSIFASSSVISCMCFMWIFVIILKHRSRAHPESDTMRRNNRSTIVVFLCCLNYVITAIINIILIFTLSQVTIVVRRSILDILYMLNGLVDAVVYVLWYRECRMELMKLLGICIPGMRQRAEKLRLELFDIVTKRQTTASTNVQ